MEDIRCPYCGGELVYSGHWKYTKEELKEKAEKRFQK